MISISSCDSPEKRGLLEILILSTPKFIIKKIIWFFLYKMGRYDDIMF